MILQALVRHYENLAAQGKVSREGWCQAKVSYGINLSREGKITGDGDPFLRSFGQLSLR